MRCEKAITAALAERKSKLGTCPINNGSPIHEYLDERCPKCGATSAGPCWVNVEADAAFVDAIKEVAAQFQPTQEDE